MDRRYDIDWLRVIAIGLLLIYHIAIGFQPWGVFIGFIQSNDPFEAIWIPMSMLNIWRVPLLFFVSGMGVWFAIQRRDWMQLLVERSKRILLPFLFGMAVIVPIHTLLWQHYYNQKIQYNFSPAHLWFLGNIFIYVIVLSPFFFFLKNKENGKAQVFIKRIMGRPFGLLIITLLFVLEVEIIQPEEFEIYAMTSHGFFIGLAAFFSGFCCGNSGDQFWSEIKKCRWTTLITAAILYFIRVFVFEMRPPDYLMAVESTNWIFALLGFSGLYLNKRSGILSYLSQAAYPIYIIHMIFIYLGSYYLFTLDISPVANFMLLNLFTFICCFLTYEFLIRRVRFLRPLFGLK